MMRDILRDRLPSKACPSREQILLEVSTQQTGNHIHQADKYDDPGGFEVEIAAPAVLVRQNIPVAGIYPRTGRRDREIEQRGSHDIPGFAPIKAWMRNYNFCSAQQQGYDAEGTDPMGDANECGMPGRDRCRWRGVDKGPSGIGH